MRNLIQKEKNPAKEFLEGYLPLKKRLDSLHDEIRECYERATDISVHYKDVIVTSSGAGGFSADIDRAIDKSFDMISVENEIREKQGRILAAIESLPDEYQKLVLTLRYIKGYSWIKISQEISYSDRNTFIIHGRALQGVKEWMRKNECLQ